MAASPTLGVANAHLVTDFLAVGGDLDYDDDVAVAQTVDLIEAGVTHVLDVRMEANDTGWWAEIPMVEYLNAGIDDAGQRVPTWWFEEIVSWALSALEDPGSLVLTHCHMGINRGPSAGFAILLGLGWDPVEAIDAIRKARPIANVWYAEDALVWHHERTGASPEGRQRDLERLADWRRQHPLDVVRVIREQRELGR